MDKESKPDCSRCAGFTPKHNDEDGGFCLHRDSVHYHTLVERSFWCQDFVAEAPIPTLRENIYKAPTI